MRYAVHNFPFEGILSFPNPKNLWAYENFMGIKTFFYF